MGIYEHEQWKSGRQAGSSPDASPTPHAAMGRVPTFLPCRLFRLWGWSQASRDSLGGDLRIKGKEEKSSLYALTSPTEGPQPVEELGGVAGQPGSVERWGPVRQEPCSPLVPADFPSPLSWGSHPSGSLYFFWRQAPLGHRSCHTEQIKGASEDHSIALYGLLRVWVSDGSVQPANMRPKAQSSVTKREMRMEWNWTLCGRRLART